MRAARQGRRKTGKRSMRRTNMLLPLCLALLAVSGLLLLSSCGGGGGGGEPARPADRAVIVPPGAIEPPFEPPADHIDEADTPEAASIVASGQSVTGYIDSADDVDYFWIELPESGADEDSLVEVEFEAPVGTEISIMDETGRVLASGTVPGSAGSSGIRTQAAAVGVWGTRVVVTPHGRLLLVRIAGLVGLTILQPYLLTVTAGAIVGTLIAHFVDNIRITNVKAGGSFDINLREYVECKLQGDNKPVEGCRFDFKLSATLGATITTKSGVSLPLEASIEGNTIVVSDVPCEAEGGTFTIGFGATVRAAGLQIGEAATKTISGPIGSSDECKLIGAIAVWDNGVYNCYSTNAEYKFFTAYNTNPRSAADAARNMCREAVGEEYASCSVGSSGSGSEFDLRHHSPGLDSNFYGRFGGDDSRVACIAFARGRATLRDDPWPWAALCVELLRAGYGSTEAEAEAMALLECRRASGFHLSGHYDNSCSSIVYKRCIE